MSLKYQKIKSIFTSVVVFSMLFGSFVFRADAKDIAPFEELSLGNSIFVFRGSSKKPQLASNSPQFVKRNITNRKLTASARRAPKPMPPRRKMATKKIGKNAPAPQTTADARTSLEKLFDKAVASYNQGRYEDAATTYRQVIALDATHPDANANLASTYRQLGRFADANARYKIAAEYIKDDTDLYSEWGFCLGKVDLWTNATARLLTAKQLNADAINNANLGWAYLNAAQSNLATRNTRAANTNFSRAKGFLEKAIEMNPQMTAALLNLGIVYNGLGEYQNAVEVLTKANAARPNWLAAANELGIAYRKSNDLPAAIVQFQKVVSLDGNFASGYFNLGEAQYQSGNKKDARKTHDRLKELNKTLALRLDGLMKANSKPTSEKSYY